MSKLSPALIVSGNTNASIGIEWLPTKDALNYLMCHYRQIDPITYQIIFQSNADPRLLWLKNPDDFKLARRIFLAGDEPLLSVPVSLTPPKHEPSNQRVSVDVIEEILEDRFLRGCSYNALANKYKLSKTSVIRFCTGKRMPNLLEKWQEGIIV